MAGPLTPAAVRVSRADTVARVHGTVVQVVLQRDRGQARGPSHRGLLPILPLILISLGNPNCSAPRGPHLILFQCQGPLLLCPPPQGLPFPLPRTREPTSLLS